MNRKQQVDPCTQVTHVWWYTNPTSAHYTLWACGTHCLFCSDTGKVGRTDQLSGHSFLLWSSDTALHSFLVILNVQQHNCTDRYRKHPDLFFASSFWWGSRQCSSRGFSCLLGDVSLFPQHLIIYQTPQPQMGHFKRVPLLCFFHHMAIGIYQAVGGFFWVKSTSSGKHTGLLMVLLAPLVGFCFWYAL